MAQNQLAALLLEASREAGQRLQAQTPHTPEWRQAQRDLVRIRADYWDEMRKAWDGTVLRGATTPRRSPAMKAAGKPPES
jgi:hypothetical protein